MLAKLLWHGLSAMIKKSKVFSSCSNHFHFLICTLFTLSLLVHLVRKAQLLVDLVSSVYNSILYVRSFVQLSFSYCQSEM